MLLRRTAFAALATAATAGAAFGLAAPANAASTPGSGSVVATLAATALPGALTIAGAGVSVTPSQTPGLFSTAGLGATAMTVSDLTGTANGWAVTATYTDPAAAVLAAGTKALGGANVKVSAANVVPDALGGVLSSNVATVTDQPLWTPVTVASTTTNSGSGVTAMTGSYKIRIPQTAVTSEVYGGTVTYTVASVR